jgi:hypothetical protein
MRNGGRGQRNVAGAAPTVHEVRLDELRPDLALARLVGRHRTVASTKPATPSMPKLIPCSAPANDHEIIYPHVHGFIG